MNAKDKIRDKWNESPEFVIASGVAVAVAASQVLNAVSNAAGRRTWSKEVKRRGKLKK